MTMNLDPMIGKIFAQHCSVFGKTRSGKSSVLRLMAEWSLRNEPRIPLCVIDPKGDWYGLRSGFKVVVFGGEHADVKLTPSSGALVADIFGADGTSCIIDLGGWRVADRTRFFIAFAERVFNQQRIPRRLLIDECHNFAPQGKIMDPQAGEMLHWSNRLASEGAGRGLVIHSASQRPQKVHKDFVTCSETLIAMRVIHKLDRNAIKDWLDGAGDETKANNILRELAEMPRGTGWVWSPEVGIGPLRVAFPKFSTFDSFAAPTAKTMKTWKPKEINLAAVQAKMVEVEAEVKKNDPAELRKRVAELEKALAKKATPGAAGSDANVAGPKASMSREEARRIIALTRMLEVFSVSLKKASDRMKVANDELVSQFEKVVASVSAMSHQTADPRPHVASPSVTQDRQRIPATPPRVESTASSSHALPKGEAAILQACLERRDTGCSREQLTVLTGYKRSSRDAYVSRLLAKQLVTVSGGRIHATDSGETALGEFSPLPKGAALQQHWLTTLPEGESKVLREVIAAYPNEVDREDLDVPYKRSSRDAYLSRLSARELVTFGRGTVRASDTLFD